MLRKSLWVLSAFILVVQGKEWKLFIILFFDIFQNIFSISYLNRKVYIVSTYFVRIELISCDESPLSITFCHKKLLDDKRDEIFLLMFFSLRDKLVGCAIICIETIACQLTLVS